MQNIYTWTYLTLNTYWDQWPKTIALHNNAMFIVTLYMYNCEYSERILVFVKLKLIWLTVWLFHISQETTILRGSTFSQYKCIPRKTSSSAFLPSLGKYYRPIHKHCKEPWERPIKSLRFHGYQKPHRSGSRLDKIHATKFTNNQMWVMCQGGRDH